jgi:hypothetical protein
MALSIIMKCQDKDLKPNSVNQPPVPALNQYFTNTHFIACSVFYTSKTKTCDRYAPFPARRSSGLLGAFVIVRITWV